MISSSLLVVLQPLSLEISVVAAAEWEVLELNLDELSEESREVSSEGVCVLRPDLTVELDEVSLVFKLESDTPLSSQESQNCFFPTLRLLCGHELAQLPVIPDTDGISLLVSSELPSEETLPFKL